MNPCDESQTALLFDDKNLDADRTTREPVLPASPSSTATTKKTTQTNTEGYPVHSFETLLKELATRCRNRCSMSSGPSQATFDQLTQRTPVQQKVMELLNCTQ